MLIVPVEHEQPLCFVLPASKSKVSKQTHRQLVAQVVRPGDVFVNVFPKHQKEVLEQHDYPGEILQILDPMVFTERLCSCRAIISARLHGVVLGLHLGVPTFGASGTSHGNKVPDVMIDAMRLPEQYFLVDENLTREVVDQEVGVVREMYAGHGRRAAIHARLSALNDEFETQARHVLFDIIGVQQQQQQPNREEQEENQGQQQAREVVPGAGDAQFLPAAFAKSGSRASERGSSSGLPSAGGDWSTTTELGGRAVGALNPGDMDTKKAKGGPATTEKAETEAEEKRATAAATSQEPATAVVKVASPHVGTKNSNGEMNGSREIPTTAKKSAGAQGTAAVETAPRGPPAQGIEREDGNATAHSTTSETKAVALKLWTSSAGVLHRSPVVPTSGAATATHPATTKGLAAPRIGRNRRNVDGRDGE